MAAAGSEARLAALEERRDRSERGDTRERARRLRTLHELHAGVLWEVVHDADTLRLDDLAMHPRDAETDRRGERRARDDLEVVVDRWPVGSPAQPGIDIDPVIGPNPAWTDYALLPGWRRRRYAVRCR